jgi:hypothetical protein
VDDNIWEYPFGDIDEDEDVFFHRPDGSASRLASLDGSVSQKTALTPFLVSI